MRASIIFRSLASIIGVAFILHGYGKASDAYRLVRGYGSELADNPVPAYAEAIRAFPDSINIYLYFMIAGFFLLLFGACGSKKIESKSRKDP